MLMVSSTDTIFPTFTIRLEGNCAVPDLIMDILVKPWLLLMGRNLYIILASFNFIITDIASEARMYLLLKQL